MAHGLVGAEEVMRSFAFSLFSNSLRAVGAALRLGPLIFVVWRKFFLSADRLRQPTRQGTRMRFRIDLRLPITVVVLVATVSMSAAVAEERSTLPSRTSLDDYISKPDSSYRWEVVSESTTDGLKVVVVDMISQTWRTPDEVNRTQWQHWIKLAIPDELRTDTGFLMIGGGSNREGEKPSGPDEMIMKIAKSTGSVVAELGMVPNQPLIFHGDGQKRTEDDLIGYTWDQFIKTGDPTWAARNPMVKSAVKAMDTITALMASEAGGKRTVDKFVVAGGSKRGWTTWLTGLDDRVVAIVPIVIDVVNADVSMKHHFQAYGFWAPAVGNYVQHKIMERLNHPRIKELYELVDPWFYRHRLSKPKFIVNGSGDQFFLPDSSQFYFDGLIGEKYLRYVPNADHGLGGSDAIESITAFYALILAGKPRPEFSWTNEDDGSIRVTTKDTPVEVLLWQATNPEARDFRIETLGPKYTSTVLEDQGGGVYVGNVEEPAEGWTAYYIELKFDAGVGIPLKLSTGVRVVPDLLPYEGKRPDLPVHVTVICEAPDETTAQTLVTLTMAGAEQRLPITNFTAKNVGTRCYFNWKPKKERLEGASGLVEWLKEQQCDGFRLQLESGPGITGLPQE